MDNDNNESFLFLGSPEAVSSTATLNESNPIVDETAALTRDVSSSHDTEPLRLNNLEVETASSVDFSRINPSEDTDDSSDVDDVEMALAVEEEDTSDMPPLEPIPDPPTARAGSRRVRIEDDDEEEQNRRRSSPRLSPSQANPLSSSIPGSAAELPSVGLASQSHLPDTTNVTSNGTNDRATRSLPRSAPSPLRQQHNAFGAGLMPGTVPMIPFDLRTMLSRVFGNAPGPENATASNSTINSQSSAIPSQGQTGVRSDPPRHDQNNFHPGPAGRYTYVISSGPFPGIPIVHPQGASTPSQGAPQGVPLSGANARPNATREGIQSPMEFIDALISNVLRDNLGQSFEIPEKEDPERAAKLIAGLEEVPLGLIRRMERLNKLGSLEENGDGVELNCAVCWEKILNDDAASDPPSVPTASAECSEDRHSISPNQSGAADGSSSTANKLQKIVSLPCTHVFHADCLVPWFSRPKQPTCPTCRFNIDPDNLTYVYRPAVPNNGPTNSASPGRHPPQPTAAQQVPLVFQNAPSAVPSSLPEAQRPHETYPSGPSAGNIPPLPPNQHPARTAFQPLLRAHLDSMPFFPMPNVTGPMSTGTTLTVDVGVDVDVVFGDSPSMFGPFPFPNLGAASNNQNPEGRPNAAEVPPNGVFGFFTFGPQVNPPRRQEGPKREWSLPAAPGLTLRQRVEKQEREAGLRCWDTSCSIGPTDDEPNAQDVKTRQISIHHHSDSSSSVCSHTFHPECLVTAERAGFGTEIEVACPVCHVAGMVSKLEWDEGQQAI